MQRKIRRQIERRLRQKATQALWTSVAAAGLLLGAYGYTMANPTGGAVTSGQATISGEGSDTVTITQISDTTSINWTGFGIDTGETVNFLQPDSSSIAVNRVTGTNASAIYGTLNANGQVFLINPNGILFSTTAQVNVGGIVASTLDFSDSDLLSGNYTFSGASTATVSNAGTITASDGGYVALLGSQVSNSGTISADQGSVALAAGSQVSLDFDGDGLLSLTVDNAVLQGLVANSGVIQADGGLVVMSAGAKDSLVATVVNNSGVIRANSVKDEAGTITLEGATITNTGLLQAAGTVSGATGGTITLDGSVITLGSDSVLDASGYAGGGTVTVGSWEAKSVSAAADSLINVSALEAGNGGSVSIIATENNVGGTILATGAGSGNGGGIETSGETLAIGAVTVNAAGGNQGGAGNWLLDPYDLTIDATAAAAIDNALDAGGNVTVKTTASDASITGAAGGSVNTAGDGDITVAADIYWTSGATLTLDAYHGIDVNADLTATGAGAGVVLITNDGGMGGSLTFNGGSLTLTGSGAALTINGNAYTLIDSAAELAVISGTGYYALGTSLDLSGSAYGTALIASFGGTLEGLGNTISNLTIAAGGSNYVGLFGSIGSAGSVENLTLSSAGVGGGSYVGALAGFNAGTIYNVGVNGGSVSGESFVGGLVGWNPGIISASYNSGSVSGTSSVGGLVGVNWWGVSTSISASYNSGNVSGSDCVGGLVGWNCFESSISASYNSGSVSGNSTVGGLVGWNSDRGSVSESYNSGSVSGSDCVGGLAGNNQSGSISESYNSGSVSGTSGVGGLVGVNGGSISTSYNSGSVNGVACSAANLFGDNGSTSNCDVVAASAAYSQSFYSGTLGWSFGTSTTDGGVWYMVDGYTMPFLKSEYSTTITNAHQLQLINLDLDASYTLAADLDLSATGTAGLWSSGFAPLGGSSGFSGVLDGNGYTISNLSISQGSNDYVGLFGSIASGGSVENLTLSPVNVSGGSYVGALAGYNAGTIYNVGVNGGSVSGEEGVGGLVGYNEGGKISVSYNGGSVGGSIYVGGLVGYNEGGSISASYNSGSVGGSMYVGGLVGVNESGSISASYNSGSVGGSDWFVGGLVGYDYGGSISVSYNSGGVSGDSCVGGLIGWDYDGNISASYNSGNISGAYYSGGLVGWNVGGSISASYNNGSVGGDGTAGGLVGYNEDGSISESYNSGSVGGNSAVGGLVGYNEGSITDSYWNSDLISAGTGDGSSLDTSCQGLNTTAMTGGSNGTAYIGWDFSKTWYCGGTSINDGYPILRSSPFVLTISAAGSTSGMTYGAAYSTSYTITVGNLWGGDTLDAIVAGGVVSYTSGGTVVDSSTTSLLNAGTYTVNVSGVTVGASSTGNNYTVIYESAAATVYPKVLTYTVSGATGGTYGTAFSGGTVALSGVVNGDTVNALVEVADGSGGSVTSGSGSVTLAVTTDAGTYTESVTGVDNNNYTVATGSAASIVIAPKTITYSVADATGTYGTAATAGTVTLFGVLTGDDVNAATVVTDTSGVVVALDAKTRVGTYSESAGSLSGSAAGNYLLTTAGSTQGTLIIRAGTRTTKMAGALSAAYQDQYGGTVFPVFPGAVDLTIAGSGVNCNYPVLTIPDPAATPPPQPGASIREALLALYGGGAPERRIAFGVSDGVNVLRLSGFAVNNANLTDDMFPALQQLLRLVKEDPQIVLTITGYTDASGDEKHNDALSWQRARAVVAYLEANGAAAERLLIQGAGQTSPYAANNTAGGAMLNRRVEITWR